MANTIPVEIVTAEKIVYSADATMVIIPASAGDIGVLPKHAPLLTTLKVGELRVKHENAPEQSIFIAGGFAEVLPDKITILADTAQRSEEMDELDAREAQKRAKDLMASATTKEDIAKAELLLKETTVKLRIVRKYREESGLPFSEEE
jgi:F-type H+-transporting ATPase subunit epsilon